jgi:hypothetical protein
VRTHGSLVIADSSSLTIILSEYLIQVLSVTITLTYPVRNVDAYPYLWHSVLSIGTGE